MPDWWEQKYQLDPLANDANGDVDGDGILNVFEYQQGLNPKSNEYAVEVIGLSGAFTLNTQVSRIDSDGDGMPDSWEIDQNLNVFGNDAHDDSDGDGRTNLEEYNAGTDPLVDDWRGPSATASPSFVVDTGGSTVSLTTDTDGDGMPDWWENRYGFNFESNDSSGDADNDGISNFAEYNSGSNPIIPDHSSVIGVSAVFLVDTGGRTFDSDADGIPDWWERLFFNDSRLANASDDSDNDGHSNAAEFNVGSNPLNANSVFKINGYQAIQEAGATQILIRWASFEGSTYSIWGATVVEGPYSLIASNVPATPPVNQEAVEGADSNVFLRIKSQRQ